MLWQGRKSNKNVPCYNHCHRHYTILPLLLSSLYATSSRSLQSPVNTLFRRLCSLSARIRTRPTSDSGGFRSNARRPPRRRAKLGHAETAMTSFTAVSMVTGDGMTSWLTQLLGPGLREAFIKPRPIHIHTYLLTSFSPTTLLIPVISLNTRAQSRHRSAYICRQLSLICF